MPRNPALSLGTAVDKAYANEQGIVRHLGLARSQSDRTLLAASRAGIPLADLARAFHTSWSRIDERIGRAKAREALAKR